MPAAPAAGSHNAVYIACKLALVELRVNDLLKFFCSSHQLLCWLQDGNMKKALELAGHAVSQASSNDWWWQERLGKAHYQLGLLRDADRHFATAADMQV